MGKDPTKKPRAKKPVHYRARPKILDHLPKEDTDHKFEHRIPLQLPLGGAPEPAYCSVLNWHSDRIDVIEVNNENYLIAPTTFDNWEIQDGAVPERRRTRPSSSQNMLNDSGISSSSRGKRQYMGEIDTMSSQEPDWGLHLGAREIAPAATSPSDIIYDLPIQANEQRYTHLYGIKFSDPPAYASQSPLRSGFSDRSSWQMGEEGRTMGQAAVEHFYFDLPNERSQEIFSPFFSHESWNTDLPLALPNAPVIATGGLPLAINWTVDYQFPLLSFQTMSAGFDNQITAPFDAMYPNWYSSEYPDSTA